MSRVCPVRGSARMGRVGRSRAFMSPLTPTLTSITLKPRVPRQSGSAQFKFCFEQTEKVWLIVIRQIRTTGDSFPRQLVHQIFISIYRPKHMHKQVDKDKRNGAKSNKL